MPERHLPVHPDLDQLKRQAKELLRAVHAGEPDALADLAQFHPERIAPADARLADAQLTLARSYRVPSWPRLVVACELTDAIWADDLPGVQALVKRHPNLVRENARGVTGRCNWGLALSYAANVGQSDIVAWLRAQGADDVQYAFGRACLRGKLDTAKLLHGWGARPEPGAAVGQCEGLNGDGLALLVELGAPLTDAHGDPRPVVAMALETYSRNPDGKHQCLERIDRHGMRLPDTPTLAVHRGRVDLLEAHVRRDPSLVNRTFSHREIYPPELGCHEDPTLALHGAPLDGGTLLHLCVDNDERDLARWLLDHGADPNARAAVDADGFGGHTALFGCVVSQPYRCGRKGDAMARLLLERGADPAIRASLTKTLRFVDDATRHEWRGVTAKEFGEQFHDQGWVNPAAMALL